MLRLFCLAAFAFAALLLGKLHAAPGDLDLTLNGTGKVTTAIGGADEIGRSVAVQRDGKIVVAGSSFNGTDEDFAVARYRADGGLDPSFGGTGKVTTNFGGGSVDQG